MSEKKCFKCQVTKPLSEFYPHSRMADGHLNKCKSCNKKDVSENYAKRRTQYSEYDQVREQDPERKAKKLEYQRKHRALHPEKYLARQAVSKAVKSGKIEKLPCCLCGNPSSEAHHKDYSKPLDTVTVKDL